MNHVDTEDVIKVGDQVLYAGVAKVIVFVIDDDSYSERCKKEDWSYLGRELGVELQDKDKRCLSLLPR
jgi:hypothetical protein